MDKQIQKQDQTQIQLKLRSLNGFLGELSELNNFEILPKNFEEAKFCEGELLSNIDNCITNLLAPVMQVRHKETSQSLKNRFATRVLEWLSLRSREYDIIDELCSILLLNCINTNIEVPERIQKWDGKITPKELQAFALVIGQSQVEVEKWITDIRNGKKAEFKELEKAEEGNLEKGIGRFEKTKPEIYKELKERFLTQNN